MADETLEDNIIVGGVYEPKDGGREVIPFFLDFANSSVQFAPVASGQEDRMSTTEFLKEYKYFGPMSSRAEEQTGEDRPAEVAEAAPVQE